VAVALTGVLYTISAWALTVGFGVDGVVEKARDPESGIPFSLIAVDFGGGVAILANALLVTSVFACMLSIHNCVARYIFAMSRDRVLSSRLVHTGRGSAAPVAGSLIQSVLGALTVLAFILLRRDPLTELFTWLTYVSAVGVLLLMAGTSVAVVGYFRRRSGLDANRWQRLVAPLLATVVLGAIVAVTVVNADSVLGTARGSALGQILPGLVAVSAVAGLAWATVLRRYRPGTYARIGHGTVDAPMPDVLAAPATAERLRRWARHRNGVTRMELWAALRTIRRLGPLWREIQGAVPEVALLPRYLAPWMTAQVRTVAEGQARRYRLTGPEADAAVEAAVLAVAVRARGRGPAPAAGDQPVLSPPDATTRVPVPCGGGWSVSARRCTRVPASSSSSEAW
jgi:hypothetical protein